MIKVLSLFLTVSGSTSSGLMPKNGLIGNPGLGAESSGEGRGVIMIPPVSGGGEGVRSEGGH